MKIFAVSFFSLQASGFNFFLMNFRINFFFAIFTTSRPPPAQMINGRPLVQTFSLSSIYIFAQGKRDALKHRMHGQSDTPHNQCPLDRNLKISTIHILFLANLGGDTIFCFNKVPVHIYIYMYIPFLGNDELVHFLITKCDRPVCT